MFYIASGKTGLPSFTLLSISVRRDSKYSIEYIIYTVKDLHFELFYLTIAVTFWSNSDATGYQTVTLAKAPVRLDRIFFPIVHDRDKFRNRGQQDK